MRQKQQLKAAILLLLLAWPIGCASPALKPAPTVAVNMIDGKDFYCEEFDAKKECQRFSITAGALQKIFDVKISSKYHTP